MGLARNSDNANSFSSLPADRQLSGFGGSSNNSFAVRGLRGPWTIGGYPARATLTTAIAGNNNDLKYTATNGGTAGNSIRIRYVVSGNNTPLSVTRSGNDITVNVATDGGGVATSTGAAVRDAVNSAMSGYVKAENATGNDGTGVVAALGFTNLTGGTDPIIGR